LSVYFTFFRFRHPTGAGLASRRRSRFRRRWPLGCTSFGVAGVSLVLDRASAQPLGSLAAISRPAEPDGATLGTVKVVIPAKRGTCICDYGTDRGSLAAPAYRAKLAARVPPRELEMFERQGEITPPCGEPSVAWRKGRLPGSLLSATYQTSVGLHTIRDSLVKKVSELGVWTSNSSYGRM
jgi:hypothetical protein